MGAPSAPHCSPSTRALLLSWCSQDTGNRLLSSLPCCSHSPAAFPRESRSGATRPHSPCRGVCCLPTWQCPHAGLKGQHPKETSAQRRSVAGQLKGQASLPSCQACHPGRRCCFIRWSLPPLSPKSLEVIAVWQCSNSLLQEVLPSLSGDTQLWVTACH